MKSILTMLGVVTTLIFASCSNSDTINDTAVTLPETKIRTKKVWVQRDGKIVSRDEDGLRLAFKNTDQIDSLLVMLSESCKKQGKEFHSLLAAYEKVVTDTEIICYLYPEFSVYDVHAPEGEKESRVRTRLAIHYMERDTPQVSLKKNQFFVEAETYGGYPGRTMTHMTDSSDEMVRWISELLGGNSDMRDEFYDQRNLFITATTVELIGFRSTQR